MDARVNHCCVCGRHIHGTSWTCSACRERHDLDKPLTEWPDWARYCKAWEARERRRDEREATSVLLMCDSHEAQRRAYGEQDDE